VSPPIVIDIEECVGCQSCVELCPDVFGFDDQSEKALVLPSGDESLDCVQEAIDTCPVECIRREE
jgi:ferredoxin